MTDIRDLLPLYAFGALDDDEARLVERAIEADLALAAELDTYIGLMPAIAPDPDVKAQLLASSGGGRFDGYASRMSKLLDVTIDRARELLGLVERKASWENPVPGIHLIHFGGGPAYAAADCGFIRVEAGCTFPWHKHRGEEVSLLMTGTVHDHEGKVWHAGDEIVQSEASEHSLTAGDEGAMYVARAMNGIEIAGQRQ